MNTPTLQKDGDAKPVGRPSLFNDELRAALIKAVGDGLSFRAAAALAKISERSFYNYCADFPDFEAAIRQSEAEAIAAHVGNIRTAGKSDWRASCWYLSHRWPTQFENPKIEDQPLDLSDAGISLAMKRLFE